MCCLRLHEKIQAHTEREREICKAMSVTLQCNLGVRQCQCSRTWRTTFHPQDSDNADRAPQNGVQSRGPCQNRAGSLSETRGLSVKTVTTLCENREGSVRTAGELCWCRRKALCSNRGRLSVRAARACFRTAGGSL